MAMRIIDSILDLRTMLSAMDSGRSRHAPRFGAVSGTALSPGGVGM